MRGSSPARRAVVLVGLALPLGVLASSVACGTEATGVEACQKIERVRCESAPACGIKLGQPLHSGSGDKSDVAACIRYYDDQCLHGLVVSKEPSPQAVDACVNAIITGDCSVVKAPESDPACAFLIPPVTPPAAPADAASESEADASASETDAAPEAG